MDRLRLKKNEDRRIKKGHLWIFNNEIDGSLKSYSKGQVVDVEDYKGRFLARGYINPHSLITIRILSRHQEEIGVEFFIKRIKKALDYRKKIYPTFNSYRVVFSEADYIPGLIVDKYEDQLVIQCLTAGMESQILNIVDALVKLINPGAIIARNDTQFRELEGLKKEKGIIFGEMKNPILIEENGLKFFVDIWEGQKTGFYFDQRENRFSLKEFVKDADVLDCFCYTGSFTIFAKSFGAKKATGIDSSKLAIEMANKNAEINGVKDGCEFIIDDVKNFINNCYKKNERYDCIILDPPSFAKSKGNVNEALSGYRKLNAGALRIISKNGILITCSCSYHVTRDNFLSMLQDASRMAERKIKLIEFKSQAKDHLILPFIRETEYLKCAILFVE